MFDSWMLSLCRGRQSARDARAVAVCLERLETRALLYYPTSVWTGYWNTNQGVLVVNELDPPHESPYPQIDAAQLDGEWANANLDQFASPPKPIYFLTADLTIDPTYAAVLTGTVSNSGGGHFKLTMNPNPGYPTTPDSFTGTFTVNGTTMPLNGTYAGDQQNATGSAILPGTDASPPRPRPIFPNNSGSSGSTGNQPSEVKVQSVEVSTTTPDTIEVDYDVIGSDATQAIQLEVFRARKNRYSEDDRRGDLIRLGNQTLSGAALTVGSHAVNFPISDTALGIDGLHPYVLAVADPSHHTREVNQFYNEESFEIRTIGIVSEGFTPGNPFSYGKPAWVTHMANSLKSKAKFTRTIPFAWASATPGRTADYAGQQLYQELVPIIQFYASSFPNDFIDFDFIGHSRGSVVISRAVEALYQNAQSLGLHDEYIKMTFLDPHPASLVYGDNASTPSLGASPKQAALAAAGAAALVGYEGFEFVTDDGPVNVPIGVNEVEDFYEDTSADDLKGQEAILNLHGLPPGNIKGFYNAPIFNVVDLTNAHLKPGNRHSPLIGHGEVTDWYQENVIDAGKEGTAYKVK